MSIVGVTGSLEVICKVAVFNPIDVGLNDTLTVKLLPGLIVLFRLPPAIAKIDASGPATEEDIRRSTAPPFLMLREAVFILFAFTVPKS